MKNLNSGGNKSGKNKPEIKPKTVVSEQKYLCVAITGDKEDIKKAVSKAVSEGLGYDGDSLNVALYYGFTDENDCFQVKPLTEIL